MGIINTGVTGDTVHSSVQTYDAVYLDATVWRIAPSAILPEGIYGGAGVIYTTVSYLTGREAGELPIDLYLHSSAVGTITATLTLASDLTAAATIGVSAECVEDAGLAYISAHETLALDRLLQQYKGKNIEDLIIGLQTDQIQAMEDVLLEYKNLFNIDFAVGDQLDKIGSVVGFRRKFLSDSTYRRFLKAKIVANSTNGAFTDVFTAWTHLSQSNEATIEEVYPAEVNLRTGEDIDSAALTLIVDLMDDCLAAGVGIGYIKKYFDTTFFSFADGDGLGFGTLTDSSIGGKLASYIWHHS